MFKNKVKIDVAMKRQIENDWKAAFPSLTKTSSSVFRRRVGPLLISVWYTYHYGTEYRPVYSTVNLLNAEKHLYAVMSQRPKSRRCDITWTQHEKGLYMEAVEELKKLASLPLEGPITLSQIINTYKNYPGTIYGGYHFEDPALIAAWAGKTELARECLDWGMEAYQERFNLPHDFETFDEWYQHMLHRISDPARLQKLLEDEVIRYKMTKVPYQDIVIDL